MGRFIAGFSKSDHFNYRQWDRKIDDVLLDKILQNIEKNNSNTLLIVSRKIIKEIHKNTNKELFIKVNKNVLITCFYCEFQEYCSLNRDQHYLLINKI